MPPTSSALYRRPLSLDRCWGRTTLRGLSPALQLGEISKASIFGSKTYALANPIAVEPLEVTALQTSNVTRVQIHPFWRGRLAKCDE